MEENINENDEFKGIKFLDNIEEVDEVEIKSQDDNEKKEINDDSLIINDNPDDDSDQYIRLASESMNELEEKKNLIQVFQDLEKVLNERENKPKSINEVYEMYLENEFITKSHIKNQVGNFLLKFMFFFEGPIYGIIFLIGIFQMKSIMKALGDLIQDSAVSYYNCYAKSNCNITISDDENNVYNFYEYYYNYSMDETIDFNLMLLTGFIGSLILKWKGFKISSGVLCAFNIGSIIWLLNFNFNFNSPGIFDYDLIKILNLCFIYILLLIGIGGSALLSHQILIESHLKYKDFLIKKIKDELESKKGIRELNNKLNEKDDNEDNKKKLILKSTDYILTKKHNFM